jgi:hypothetical protein
MGMNKYCGLEGQRTPLQLVLTSEFPLIPLSPLGSTFSKLALLRTCSGDRDWRRSNLLFLGLLSLEEAENERSMDVW